MLVDKVTETEFELSQKLIGIQNHFLNGSEKQREKSEMHIKGKKMSTVTMDRSSRMSKKKSVHGKLSNDYIQLFYRGQTKKVPISKIGIWGVAPNQQNTYIGNEEL
jgi:hypothetical protein